MNRLYKEMWGRKNHCCRFAIGCHFWGSGCILLNFDFGRTAFSDIISQHTSGSANADEIGLLVGSTPQKERKVLLERLSSGKIKVIVGTHALLEDPVIFNNLQLAVIDEQHRFGVGQRNLLKKKGNSQIQRLSLGHLIV
jgi:hypothetical protein